MISNSLSARFKPTKSLSNNKINKNYLKNITKANPKIKPLTNRIKNVNTFNKKNAKDIMNDLNEIDRLTKNFPTLFNEKYIIQNKNNNIKNYSKTIEKDNKIKENKNNSENNKVAIKYTLTDIKDKRYKKNINSSLFSNNKIKKKNSQRNSYTFSNSNSINIDKVDKIKNNFNIKNNNNINLNKNNKTIENKIENIIENNNNNNNNINNKKSDEIKFQNNKKDEDEVYYSLLKDNIMIVESESNSLLSCLSQQDYIKQKEFNNVLSDGLKQSKNEELLLDNLDNDNENEINNITTPKSNKNIRINIQRSTSLKDVQHMIEENQKQVFQILPQTRKNSSFLFYPSLLSSPEKLSKKSGSKIFSSSTLNSYYDLSNNKIKKQNDQALTPLPKYNHNKNNFNQMTFKKILDSTKFLRRMQYTVKVHKKNMKYFFDRRFKIIQRAWRHYYYGVKIPKVKKIQKYFRGYLFRKSNKYRIMLINKRLNAFYNRIKLDVKKKHFYFLIHKLKMLVRAQKNIKDLNEIGIQVNFNIKPIVKYVESNKEEIEFNKLFNVKNLCGVKTFPRPWNEIANNGKILAKFLKKNVFDKLNLNEDDNNLENYKYNRFKNNKVKNSNNIIDNNNNISNSNNEFNNNFGDNNLNKNIILNDYTKNKNYLKLLKKIPINNKWYFITKMNNYIYIKKIIFIQKKIKSFLKKLRKNIINKKKRYIQINFFLFLLFAFYKTHIQKKIFKLIKGNFYFPFTNITISEEINESYEKRRLKMIENLSYKNKINNNKNNNKNNVEDNKKSCFINSRNESETEFTNLNNNKIFSSRLSDLDLEIYDKNKIQNINNNM